MTKVSDSWIEHCKGIMNNDELTEQIKKHNFDIAIGEGFDSCIFGLYKQYGITQHILISSGLFFSPHYQLLGLNYPSTQVPDFLADFGANGFSFYERVKNQYFGLISYLFLKRPLTLEQDLFDAKFGKGIANIRKTFSECAYYITNADPFLDFAKPITSKIIEIGGFSIPKSKPLDDYFDKVMALRTKNILISFGSNAKSYLMPDTTFIWKYELDDGIADGIDNLITSKWLPQTDILADKRLTGFITHVYFIISHLLILDINRLIW
uniref:Glucuronosyltransferase n=1 Tax=Rhabditophanes sp. KR3021 TaxID=114890 RepID=A0AC35UE62_9BILA